VPIQVYPDGDAKYAEIIGRAVETMVTSRAAKTQAQSEVMMVAVWM
jgi:hypothetical protein